MKRNKEYWADIKGYEGLYQVSSVGRVRAFAKMVSYRTGNQFKPTSYMRPTKITSGYLTVTLTKDKKQRTFTVHRLVAMCFVDGFGKTLQVNHIDGNKTNNRYSNLEWCTQSENTLHAYRIGLFPATRRPRVFKKAS